MNQKVINNLVTQLKLMLVALGIMKSMETESVPPVVSKLAVFTQSIAQYEGGDTAGTIPYKCNNPGDLRWPYGAPYPYGATGTNFGDFLVFPSPKEGMNALTTYVTNVAMGKSKIYPANCTIEQFFNIYAPSDDANNPNAYAAWVANRTGVEVGATLSSLLT
jgi:hypothetical protein